MSKKPSLKQSQEVAAVLKNGEHKTVFMKNWDDHVKDNSEIANFTTIIADQLYHVKPREDEIFLPYSEFLGDHVAQWILGIDIKTGNEFMRKSVRHVDMIDWKLSSSTTNPSKNEK